MLNEKEASLVYTTHDVLNELEVMEGVKEELSEAEQLEVLSLLQDDFDNNETINVIAHEWLAENIKSVIDQRKQAA